MRLFLTFLMVLLPLQWTAAATAHVCPHGSAGQAPATQAAGGAHRGHAAAVAPADGETGERHLAHRAAGHLHPSDEAGAVSVAEASIPSDVGPGAECGCGCSAAGCLPLPSTWRIAAPAELAQVRSPVAAQRWVAPPSDGPFRPPRTAQG